MIQSKAIRGGISVMEATFCGHPAGFDGKEGTAMLTLAMDSKSVKVQRRLSGLACLLLVLTVLFSAFYIAAEANHDCGEYGCGEHNCPVCACIQQCTNTLKQFKAAVAVSAFPAILVAIVALLALLSLEEVRPETLVSQKIRLNR